jgi:hypothetical protein
MTEQTKTFADFMSVVQKTTANRMVKAEQLARVDYPSTLKFGKKYFKNQSGKVLVATIEAEVYLTPELKDKLQKQFGIEFKDLHAFDVYQTSDRLDKLTAMNRINSEVKRLINPLTPSFDDLSDELKASAKWEDYNATTTPVKAQPASAPTTAPVTA